ncbi:MAG: lamin tail domain-containing protein [Pseudomonadota bacterium]
MRWTVLSFCVLGLGVAVAACDGGGVSKPGDDTLSGEVWNFDGGGDQTAEIRFRSGDAGDGGGTPDDSVFPGDAPPGPDTTGPATSVAAVQEAPESKSCGIPFASQLVTTDLAFKDLVVTAPSWAYQSSGIKYDGFYVQDPGGGVWQGVMVAFPHDAMPALETGMEVDVVADHKEIQCLTVLWASSVKIVGQEGAPYSPILTTPQALTGDDAESFEGVFVEVEGVTVTDANPDAVQGADLGRFEVDGILRVGNDYQLPYMTGDSDSRDVGDQFDILRGVMTWRDGVPVLMPRKPGDMKLLGGDPPPDSGEDTVSPPPDTLQPPEDTAQPPEDTVPPPEDTVSPPEDTVPPPEDTIQSPDEYVPPDIPAEPDSDLVITEIMYDPSDGVADDKGEWVEIHNTTGDDIDINGYRLADAGGNMHIIQNGGPLIVAAGAYFVFGVNFYESENGGVEVDYLLPYAIFQLDNSADEVILMDKFGMELDRVEYAEGPGWPTASGASLSLIHPNLDNNVGGNWVLATTPWGATANLGTPGTENIVD